MDVHPITIDTNRFWPIPICATHLKNMRKSMGIIGSSSHLLDGKSNTWKILKNAAKIAADQATKTSVQANQNGGLAITIRNPIHAMLTAKKWELKPLNSQHIRFEAIKFDKKTPLCFAHAVIVSGSDLLRSYLFHPPETMVDRALNHTGPYNGVFNMVGGQYLSLVWGYIWMGQRCGANFSPQQLVILSILSSIFLSFWWETHPSFNIQTQAVWFSIFGCAFPHIQTVLFCTVSIYI